MKQLYIILLACLLVGCQEEQLMDNSLITVSIQGNQLEGMTRNNEGKNIFTAGDNASLFSQGGINANNIALTYQDGEWHPETPLYWDKSGNDASVVVYYPAFASTQQELYDTEGNLKDILYAAQETPYGKPVELQFEHLFAKITFETDESIHTQMQNIRFTPSVRLASIEPHTRTFTFAETPAPTVSFEKRTDRIYTLFIPPADNVSVDIRLVTPEGELQLTTPTQSFISGHQYTYRLISKEKETGIYTAEEFIAFSHLINGMEYEGYTLDDFGHEVDGVMTYFLCADIAFTEEQSELVQPIGCKSTALGKSKSFNKCFDGQGHSLSNLRLITPEDTKHQGLFGYIGERGMVKDLTLENCSYVNLDFLNETHYDGMIVGFNEGNVIGCHVLSCSIEDKAFGYAGGLVGENKGTIANSSVCNVSFEGRLDGIGGLCGHNYLYVINSYASSCQFTKNANAGGLCYNMASGAVLTNCYVHAPFFNGNSQSALFSYQLSAGVSNNCYYPKDSGLKEFYKGTKNEGKNYAYDTDFTVTDTGETLLDALNAWVDKQQGEYNGLPLLHWEAGDEGVPAKLAGL